MDNAGFIAQLEIFFEVGFFFIIIIFTAKLGTESFFQFFLERLR
jgi:hypothetical protein